MDIKVRVELRLSTDKLQKVKISKAMLIEAASYVLAYDADSVQDELIERIKEACEDKYDEKLDREEERDDFETPLRDEIDDLDYLLEFKWVVHGEKKDDQSSTARPT